MTYWTNIDIRRDRVGLWVVAGVLFAGMLYAAWRYVGTVMLGLFVYYVTRPVFYRIERTLSNRTLAAGVAIVAVTLPVLALIGWTLSVAVQQLSLFAKSTAIEQVNAVLDPYLDLTEIRTQVEAALRLIIADPGQLRTLDLSALSGLFDAIVNSFAQFVNVGLHLFIVLIITFYLLRDDYRVAAWSRRTFLRGDGVLDEYFTAVDRDLKNVFFGNILNALLTGLLAVVTYLTLNSFAPANVRIPEAALIGLLVGVASLVPVIGIKLVTVPVTLYLLARSLVVAPETVWFPVLFAAVSFVVVDYIPDQLLRPYVSGRTLHVGAVMLAYTFGPLLFGWYGIFLGPFVLVVVFEFARTVVPWLVDPEYEREEASETEVVGDVPPMPETVESVPTDTAEEEGGPAGVPPDTADEV